MHFNNSNIHILSQSRDHSLKNFFPEFQNKVCVEPQIVLYILIQLICFPPKIIIFYVSHLVTQLSKDNCSEEF